MQTADLNVIREVPPQQPATWGYRTIPNRYTSTTFRGYANPNTILQDPSKPIDSTAFGANPTGKCYLNVGALSKDGNSMSAYTFDITLRYDVELSVPKAAAVEEEN